MEQNLVVDASGNASLNLSGNLDRDSLSKDFFQSLAKSSAHSVNGAKQLLVSLKSVERVDTAGLAWLINIVRDGKAKNINVTFADVPDKLLHLADLSGAKEILQA